VPLIKQADRTLTHSTHKYYLKQYTCWFSCLVLFFSFVCAEPVEIHLDPIIEYPRDLPPCPCSREPNQQVISTTKVMWQRL